MSGTKILAGFTQEELEAELAARKAKANQLPEPLESPDYARVRETVIAVFKDAVRDGYLDESAQTYVSTPPVALKRSWTRLWTGYAAE